MENTAPDSRSRTANQHDRFVLLDIARTFAALAVVFWHWQHFSFSGGALAAGFDRSAQPLYFIFLPFYERGWLAVDFFFMLSGYIFFWKYKAPVCAGSIGAKHFFFLRFSRLYPLHLVTLLTVAMLQAAYYQRHGGFFIFPFNDIYHFFLHLFLGSQWGLQRGPSFNDPVWSLSVEVILYAVFFWVAKYAGGRSFLLYVLAGAGFAIYASNLSNAIGRGIFCFFIGGVLAVALRSTTNPIQRNPIEKVVYLALAIWVFLASLLWLNGAWQYWSEGMSGLIVHLLPALQLQEAKIAVRLVRLTEYFFVAGILFPLLITALVFLERRFHVGVRPFAFLGNISYSSYLLHFPLQLACVLLYPQYFSSATGAYAGFGLIAFFVVLIAISFCSFHLLEAPAQAAIRRRTLRRLVALEISPQRS